MRVLRHVFRSAVRHILRTRVRSGICVLLASLLSGVMGALAMTRAAYQEMYDNVEVKVYFIGAASDVIPGVPQALIEDPYNNVKDLYYKTNFRVYPQVNGTVHDLNLVVTNDISRAIESSMLASDFGSGKCVLGQEAAEALGLKAGDKITLGGAIQVGVLEILGEGAPRNEGEFYVPRTIKYTVGGILPEGGRNIFITAEKVQRIYNRYLESHIMNEFEFTVIDNSRLDAAVEYAELLVSRSQRTNKEANYVMDTAELENITRMIDLLNALYPIAVAAAVLVGLLAPALAILQAAKESAIHRMLGVTKLCVRCMLAAEHMILCVAGLLIAAAGLALYDAALIGRSIDALLLCGGLYLAGYILAVIVASIIITRRKVLELLQVKE